MTPTAKTYPGFLASSYPSSPARTSPSLSNSPLSPLSPAPLPIPIRSQCLPFSKSSSNLPTSSSDSETEVEGEEGDSSASDTCASDSDADLQDEVSWLKSNFAKSKAQRKRVRAPVPKWIVTPADEVEA